MVTLRTQGLLVGVNLKLSDTKAVFLSVWGYLTRYIVITIVDTVCIKLKLSEKCVKMFSYSCFRISHRIKKCKQKGSGEQRANKLKWPISKPRICPQRTERPKTRVQPLKEKRKKPSPTNHPSCLSVSPPPFLYNPEEYFYQLFCKCEFFSSSRNIFKRWGEILPHPIF